MATNAHTARTISPGFTTKTAPRFRAPAGSIAALVQKPQTTTTDLAAGWVLLWQACGGDVTTGPDGKCYTFMPMPAARAEGLLGPIGFAPQDEAEWRGATMCLAAMLSLAGPEAAEAISLFGTGGR